MEMPSLSRLHIELRELLKSNNYFDVDHTDLFDWIVRFKGPYGTVYQDLTYAVRLSFSRSFPLTPPQVTFINGCFHPNISAEGSVCMDLLKSKWDSKCSIGTILLAIVTLMVEPNIDSALNGYAALLWVYPDRYREFVYNTYRPCIK